MTDSWTSGTQPKRHFPANGCLPIRVPKPGQHRGRITAWGLFWPWSLAWTVCLNPFRCIVRSLAREIGATFEGIGEHEFGAVERDFECAVLESEPLTPPLVETEPQDSVPPSRPVWTPPYPQPRRSEASANEARLSVFSERPRLVWRN
jgi:hypothetical protein